ncbi:MAG TPA: transposase, partial [Verrucomicrobiae bacterium]|nr:transposase [Verrucomicrobiae bacterium]
CWHLITNKYPNVSLDEWVIMPDHMHGIVHIGSCRGDVSSPRLGAVIAFFKYRSAAEVNRIRRSNGAPVWQRSYHDRVIRDDGELHRIRLYIRENPQKWHQEHRGDETSPLQVDEPRDIG